MAKRLTISQFIEKAREVHGDKYDYSLVEYKNNKTKIKIICPIHGEFEQLPINHLGGIVCPKCNRKKQKHTTESFIEKSIEVHGDKYDYSLVEYKGIYSIVKIICPIHGVFKQKANNHLQGSICPKCASNRRFTTEEVLKKAREVHGDKYDYSLVEYRNTDTLVKIICPIHGIFEQTPYHHINKGYGCPTCRESHGEKRIRVFLEENDINFEMQKRFDDLKYIHHLRYDFYLPKYNLLIEYDGQQHFEEDTLYSNEDLFIRDEIKNKYAFDNGYKLLRIGYWEEERIEDLIREVIY